MAFGWNLSEKIHVYRLALVGDQWILTIITEAVL